MISTQELRDKMEYALEQEETYSSKVIEFYRNFVEELVPDSEVRAQIEPLIRVLQAETNKHARIIGGVLQKIDGGEYEN